MRYHRIRCRRGSLPDEARGTSGAARPRGQAPPSDIARRGKGIVLIPTTRTGAGSIKNHPALGRDEACWNQTRAHPPFAR